MTAPMIAPVPAAKRLAAAKSALVAAKRQVSELEEKRRAALIDGDDERAATIDLELEDRRRLVQRLADKINLLPQLVTQEEFSQRFPGDASAAQARLAALQKRSRTLSAKQGIPLHPTSASEDSEMIGLRAEISLLGKHMERCGLSSQGVQE